MAQVSSVDPIRIGWLTQDNCVLPPTAQHSSVGTVIWQLASRLRERADIELILGTRPHPHLGMDLVTVDGIRYVRADIGRDVRRGRAIRRLNQAQRKLGLRDVPDVGRPSYFRDYVRHHVEHFRQAGVDVVHLENYSQWVPTIRRELPSARIVLQMHSEWLVEIPYALGLERLTQVDRVLGVSTHIAEQIRERYPELAARVHVLPNGADPTEFPGRAEVLAQRSAEVSALRTRFGLGDGPVILFVGRISAEKSLHTLFEAMPAILAHAPTSQLVLCGPPAGLRSPLPTSERRELAGRPDWRARYPAYLKRIGAPLGDRVVFAGRISEQELPLAYALATVYVQPSLFESFGLPVAEAMASEVPVVATATGGLLDLVEHGETGYLVPTREPGALGDAIVQILLDPMLAERLGRAGRATILRGLTWDHAADRLHDIYTGLRHRTELAPIS